MTLEERGGHEQWMVNLTRTIPSLVQPTVRGSVGLRLKSENEQHSVGNSGTRIAVMTACQICCVESPNR